MTTQAERIASVESEVRGLSRRIDKVEGTLTDMDKKLDDLLVLRYKGAGAFWLASALVGTGIVGFFTQILNWFK